MIAYYALMGYLGLLLGLLVSDLPWHRAIAVFAIFFAVVALSGLRVAGQI